MSETDKKLDDLENKGIQISLLKYQVEVFPAPMFLKLDDSENFNVVVTMIQGKKSLQINFPVSTTMLVDSSIKFDFIGDFLLQGIQKQIGRVLVELNKNFLTKVDEKKKQESL